MTPDNLTTEQRTRAMQAVKHKDSKIEVSLRKALWKRGHRYRKNYKRILGKPDIAFVSLKIAVFCDSDFWHGYNWEIKKHEIKSNKKFWHKKIETNIKRDDQVTRGLKKTGWIVIRFWGHEIKQDIEKCVAKVEKAIKRRKQASEKLV